jgi:ferredoxin-type protein NapG
MSELNRRQWLARIAPAALEFVARPIEKRVERHFPAERRPPGARPEMWFRALCTGCGECDKACPHQAIFTFNEEAGANAGTPVMIPDRTPCHMCSDLPCVSACREGALIALADGSQGGQRVAPIGTVEVDSSRCIAAAGLDCGACKGLCPGDLEALVFDSGVPEVDAGECLGCGLCIEACPTNPPAIRLLPLQSL